MLIPTYRNKFKKEVEKAKKQGRDIQELKKIIELLINEKPLPLKCKDHKLVGSYKGYRECHIAPDWLLVYMKTDTELFLERTGSHSDLFK